MRVDPPVTALEVRSTEVQDALGSVIVKVGNALTVPLNEAVWFVAPVDETVKFPMIFAAGAEALIRTYTVVELTDPEVGAILTEFVKPVVELKDT